ncbi:MAG: asparagine synthase (glutamine-hydrolyzing) [Candidatus Xenobiia bacterium LiM19]
MCGIAGFYHYGDIVSTISEESLKSMGDALAHRGPDDEGLFIDGTVGLAHRRLSILDLSLRGHQPMADSSGRFWIVYNGEIYNFRDIRHELDKKGHIFSSNSDTEVILTAYREWGPGCLTRFIGMFAFALWDREERILFIARDRLGVKPLFYYHHNGRFAFASELKALMKYPSLAREIDMQSLFEYFVFQYVPEPRGIFRHTFKVLPGHYLTVSAGGVREESYWDIFPVNKDTEIRTENEYRKRLEELLDDSMRLRQVSDVPVGVLLSGGIDSTVAAAFMQAQNSNPIKTFTIGFEEQYYNEAPYARKVAQYLGTEHFELYVTPQHAFEVIEKLPDLYDEPYSDSSAIPTCLVSGLARQHVKVCLSGDGGDELFCGYNRYEAMKRMSSLAALPFSREISRLLSRAPRPVMSVMERSAELLLRKRLKTRMSPGRLREALHSLSRHSQMSYLALVKIWGADEARRLTGIPDPSLRDTLFCKTLSDALEIGEPECYSLVDIKTYLVGDILTKVDRASMAWGLEAREPLLDHRLVEFAVKLPFSLKSRQGRQKYLLKEVLYERVPQSLLERPKQGFGIPVSQWLSNELKHLLLQYLDPVRIKREGILEPSLISESLRQHFDGVRDHGYRLYNLLMFEMWYERHMQ